MNFELISNLEDWDSLSWEWDALFSASIMPVPFLEQSYLRAWWETCGGGEWAQSNCSLSIITAREAGKLVGIAPFFLAFKKDSPLALRFLGQVEVSDYLDFIVLPGKLERFLDGLLRFIQTDSRFLIKRLELHNFLENSPSLSLLSSLKNSSAWVVEEQVLQPSPYISLQSSWEDYLASLAKKQRHEVRRKERNTEERHQTHWYIVSDPAVLDQEMQDFIAMMRKDPSKKIFLNDKMERHLKLSAHQAMQKGQLMLAFLTLDGSKAAAYMSFVSYDKLWVYNSAWEPEFAEASPGWVLLAKIIRWAIEQGIAEVDMMRGDEIYKYRLGGIDRHVWAVNLQLASAS